MTDQPDDKQPLLDQYASAFSRLRRLQEHARSDMKAVITSRAATSFTLQPEPVPPEAARAVTVVVYPQDPFVGKPEVRNMDVRDIQPGLVNSRFKIQDSAVSAAQPDADGDYLYMPGSPEFEQVNAFYYATFTLRMYERYAQRALPWSFPTPRLSIDPHVGYGANAFYNEQDRLMGFDSFKYNGETVATAQSADIVSHETGHAVLDGLRDLHNESFGLGASSFHESFGDMTAMLVALHDYSLIQRLLDWTGGNLRLDNFIAAVAEQLTNRLKERAKHVQGHTVYLRNALNTLTNVPFDKLPYNPANPEKELGRECHNYSRLFTGAFYDLLVGIYERLRQQIHPYLAMHRARRIAGGLLVGAVELGPVGEYDFADMALAFITAEQFLFQGKYADIMLNVFCRQRGIVSLVKAEAHREEIAKLPDVRLPETLNSAMASALFLEKDVIPALGLPKDVELIPLGAYRNAAGNAYVTYFSTRSLKLEGDQFQQFASADIEVFGGLTLMFDSANRLRSAFFRSVRDEDLRQVRIQIGDLVQVGLIAHSLYPTGGLTQQPLHAQPEAVQGVVLPGIPGKESPASRHYAPKLVKFPVLFDMIPKRMTDLVTYLNLWKENDE
jgi:hypothetical protein